MTSIAPIPDVELRQLVLFRLADGLHAIDLHHVREIIPLRRTTRLPGAPSYIAGLINVRGTIVTVLDLGARLGGRPVAGDASVVLVEERGKLVGVAVDEVLEVLRLAPADIEAPGAEHAATGVVSGLGHSGESIVILLDIHAIIQHVLL
ncbi:MAG TPA: chemotaxis protein CheW [Gemmatimonadaceae bacterium]|nr:chemotaxis protein CheW [Gemmatimonadaceae bacterium]